MATTAPATVGNNHPPDTMEMDHVPASSSAASGSELRHRVTNPKEPSGIFGPSSSPLFDAPSAASSAARPQTMKLTGGAYERLKADLTAAAEREAEGAKSREIAQIKTRSAQDLQTEKNHFHCGDFLCGGCLGFLFAAFLAGR